MRILLACALLALSACVSNSPHAVHAGEFLVEPPTLINLGFEWRVEGDENHNASVEVRYRRKGEGQSKRQRFTVSPFEPTMSCVPAQIAISVLRIVNPSKYIAIKIYGPGHVIAYNYVANFHDGIDIETYGNPDGSSAQSEPKYPRRVSIGTGGPPKTTTSG